MLRMIGFDGDDTLWHSEGYYRAAHDEFERTLGRYVDLQDARVHERLLATERRNIKLFGYGAKGMTLSLLETAIELSGQRISAVDLQHLLDVGKRVLAHPVELLPGIADAVAGLAEEFPLALVTKGDLFHQEAKVAACGLADTFHRIEIVSEKDAGTYARLCEEFAVAPCEFAMVGNSLRSDIAPVVRLGGWGVYMPYAMTWAHEQDSEFEAAHERVEQVAAAGAIPAAVARLQAKAAGASG
jgi:putative hydrolase of the HAD superfamily